MDEKSQAIILLSNQLLDVAPLIDDPVLQESIIATANLAKQSVSEENKSLETMLKEFHMRHGVPMRDKPTVDIPSDELYLRWRLISEETEELKSAMFEDDLVGIADGLADLIYVTAGTALTYGIPIDKILSEIHRSNLTKTGLREDGKVLKGDYSPPQLADILESEG